MIFLSNRRLATVKKQRIIGRRPCTSNFDQRPTVKIVIAPDSFKGTLSASEVAAAIAEGIRTLHAEWRTLEVPIADGGEGTVETVLTALPGRRVSAIVKSPLLTHVRAHFAVLDDGRMAVVEMAQASGLTLVPEEQRNPLATTTFGTGQLVRRAMQEGCRKILIGIGGSATVDGGTGMAAALGVRFLDDEGNDIPLGAGGLSRLHRIDLSARVDLSGIQIAALSDVTNPLLGEDGAAKVFAPQKGASPEMVQVLERNLAWLAGVMRRDLGVDVADVAGAGAAGGLGAGIIAFLGGTILPGVQTIIDLVGLRQKIRGADLVITGEGRFDLQTAKGKAPLGVAEAALKLGVPVLLICGSLGEGAREAAEDRFIGISSLTELAGCQKEAMLHPKQYLKAALTRFLADNPPPWRRPSPSTIEMAHAPVSIPPPLQLGENE
jgi:glycerate kinase